VLRETLQNLRNTSA